MAKKIIAHQLTDWSQMDAHESWLSEVDLSNVNRSFGLHPYHNGLWSSGFVGVSRVYDAQNLPIQTKGKEHVLVLSSRFGLNPWLMLEKVMTDDEYGSYIEELKKNEKFLFRVFYDQPLIQLAQDTAVQSDLLYALSFIHSCYFLCKKGVKKTMHQQEENYSSKIRGRIDVKQNIRQNTCHGRNDKFYCRFIDFTADNLENRILKATLVKCKKILARRFDACAEVHNRLRYCLNAFRAVRNVTVKTSDFSNVSASGLYSYYKPLLRQAKCIYSQRYYSYTAPDGITRTKSVFTIPYMINMETVFEFYARVMLKENLNPEKYELEKYSAKIFLETGVTARENTTGGIHLMPYCIPDIIVKDRATGAPVLVLDAKYKANQQSDRSDSLQLLSYVLLTGARKCGFVLPGSETKLKQLGGKDFLSLQAPIMEHLDYWELILGDSSNEDVISAMLD